jgi:hypothetical protein
VTENSYPVAPTTARRPIALLAVLAMLLQATLFAWHHHSLPAMARGAHAAVSVHNTALPLSPAADEDRCEICIALHHLSVSPLDFAMPPLPATGTAVRQLPDQAFVDRASDRAFRARAPPPRA